MSRLFSSLNCSLLWASCWSTWVCSKDTFVFHRISLQVTTFLVATLSVSSCPVLFQELCAITTDTYLVRNVHDGHVSGLHFLPHWAFESDLPFGKELMDVPSISLLFPVWSFLESVNWDTYQRIRAIPTSLRKMKCSESFFSWKINKLQILVRPFSPLLNLFATCEPQFNDLENNIRLEF